MPGRQYGDYQPAGHPEPAQGHGALCLRRPRGMRGLSATSSTTASGVVRETAETDVFATSLATARRDQLATLDLLPGGEAGGDRRETHRHARSGTASPSTGSLEHRPPGQLPKYTRSKVRKAMPRELRLHHRRAAAPTHGEDVDQARTTTRTSSTTIIDIGQASNFIVQLSPQLIKRLAVDHAARRRETSMTEAPMATPSHRLAHGLPLASTSSGATTTSAGWARRPAPRRAWPRSCATASTIKNRWTSSRAPMASP